ncbi:MAG: hypothetical protein ABIJ09_26510 [Pseudomonadota bacterium]
MHPHDPLVELFKSFACAVQQGDAEAFRGLCNAEAAQDTALFEANSHRIRSLGWHLELDAVVQEGGVAEVRFQVVQGDKDVVDRASLTCVQDAQGWKIASM